MNFRLAARILRSCEMSHFSTGTRPLPAESIQFPMGITPVLSENMCFPAEVSLFLPEIYIHASAKCLSNIGRHNKKSAHKNERIEVYKI